MILDDRALESIGTSNIWSGGPGSNRRPSPWKGDILPLNYRRKLFKIFKKTLPVNLSSNRRSRPGGRDILPLNYRRKSVVH
jgi:hypothetical protein